VQHTYEVLADTDYILRLITEIQNSQRGYTITGDSLYLASYLTGIDSINTYVADLKRLTTDNPLQQKRIDSLQIQVVNAVNQQKYQVMLRANGHMPQLMQSYSTQEGKNSIDQIKNLLKDIEQEERQLLDTRTKALDATYTLTKIVLYGIVLVCTFIIILLFVFLTNVFTKKELYEKELSLLNEDLYHSNQEMQVFNEELNSNREELFATVEQLEVIKNELETIVDERTSRLQESNNQLLQEIQKHKSTENALLLSQERLRLALENAQLVVFNADKDLRYTWVYNAEAAFGKQPVLGKTDLELLPEPDARQIMDLKRKVFETKKGVKEEVKVSGINNQVFYFISNMQPLYDISGEVQEITGVAVNITDRKKVEKKLQNTLKELQKRNNELDNYVYKVSHDLRAPLTSVMGLINLIHAEQNPQQVAHYIGLIENRVNKLDDFIKSILNHSKSINSELRVTPIDFAKIIGECTEELRYLKNSDKIDICTEIRELESYHSDELRLTILFKNFISNAIKYLNPQAPKSFLKISICTTASQAQIVLADNGIGISQEYITKIYDMFFRATQSSDGSGLGLYIVKQNIEKLQGSVQVTSEINEGTTFTIVLPNFVNKTLVEQGEMV
jgi:PAS domain S-box-containing protein